MSSTVSTKPFNLENIKKIDLNYLLNNLLGEDEVRVEMSAEDL